MCVVGIWIEKGMGLIIPGLTPDTLGEIYEYYPTLTEVRVAAGVFAVGFLVFTLMLKAELKLQKLLTKQLQKAKSAQWF